MNQDGAAATGWCEQSNVMGRAPAWRVTAARMALLLQGWITSAQRMSITPVREELGVEYDTLEGGAR
jgi:hypothetical protein